MTAKIRELINNMRALREGITGHSYASEDFDDTLKIDSPPTYFGYTMFKADRDFIAASPENQARMEAALLIAVEALEKIELSHYEDCDYWEEEDEEADCNCGSYKRRQTALAAIEIALKGEPK